jgi:hypothetical protein
MAQLLDTSITGDLVINNGIASCSQTPTGKNNLTNKAYVDSFKPRTVAKSYTDSNIDTSLTYTVGSWHYLNNNSKMKFSVDLQPGVYIITYYVTAEAGSTGNLVSRMLNDGNEINSSGCYPTRETIPLAYGLTSSSGHTFVVRNSSGGHYDF